MEKNKVLLLLASIYYAIIIVVIYFPIKFAVRYEDVYLDPQWICCAHNDSSPCCWYEIKDNSRDIDNRKQQNYCFDVLNNPVDNLSNQTLFCESFNLFAFKGEIGNITGNCDGYLVKKLRVEEWEIIYPIERDDVSRLFLPRSYLTIIDYPPNCHNTKHIKKDI